LVNEAATKFVAVTGVLKKALAVSLSSAIKSIPGRLHWLSALHMSVTPITLPAEGGYSGSHGARAEECIGRKTRR